MEDVLDLEVSAALIDAISGSIDTDTVQAASVRALRDRRGGANFLLTFGAPNGRFEAFSDRFGPDGER